MFGYPSPPLSVPPPRASHSGAADYEANAPATGEGARANNSNVDVRNSSTPFQGASQYVPIGRLGTQSSTGGAPTAPLRDQSTSPTLAHASASHAFTGGGASVASEAFAEGVSSGAGNASNNKNHQKQATNGKGGGNTKADRVGGNANITSYSPTVIPIITTSAASPHGAPLTGTAQQRTAPLWSASTANKHPNSSPPSSTFGPSSGALPPISNVGASQYPQRFQQFAQGGVDTLRSPRGGEDNSSNCSSHNLLSSVGSHAAPTTIVREPNEGAGPRLPTLPVLGGPSPLSPEALASFNAACKNQSSQYLQHYSTAQNLINKNNNYTINQHTSVAQEALLLNSGDLNNAHGNNQPTRPGAVASAAVGTGIAIGQPSVSSHTSNVTGGAGGGGGRRTAGTATSGFGHTSLDAVTAFDFENDRDCPPAINTNALQQRGRVYVTSSTGGGTVASNASSNANMLTSDRTNNNNTNINKAGSGLRLDLARQRRGTAISSVDLHVDETKVIDGDSVVVAVDGGEEHHHAAGGDMPFLTHTNNFTLPPIAIEDKRDDAYQTEGSTYYANGGVGGGYTSVRHSTNNQNYSPLSAYSATDGGTSRGRRHVTVNAPQGHKDTNDLDGGGGGGLFNGVSYGGGGGYVGYTASSNRYGGQTATLWNSYGIGGSEGVYGIAIGGLTDDNYFGSESTSGDVFGLSATGTGGGGGGGLGASYTSRNAMGNSGTSLPQAGAWWRAVFAFLLHPMITATITYVIIAAYAVARLGVEFNYFNKVWLEKDFPHPPNPQTPLVPSNTNTTTDEDYNASYGLANMSTTYGGMNETNTSTTYEPTVDPNNNNFDPTHGLPYVRSGALWAGIISLLIVLTVVAHCIVIIAHRMHSRAAARKAAIAAQQQALQAQMTQELQQHLGADEAAVINNNTLMKGSTGTIPSFNNSANALYGGGAHQPAIRHNRAARISVTVAYVVISVLLVALSVVEGLTGGAHFLALAMPLLGTSTLRPILNTRIVITQVLISLAAVIIATVLLYTAKKGEEVVDMGPRGGYGGLAAFVGAVGSAGRATEYPLPTPDRLWIRLGAFMCLAFTGFYCVLAQYLRGDARSFRLLREQHAVSEILNQLVDLNVESAKRCLDDALQQNPTLGDGQHEAFSAATKLINGLTLFRSYVPTAVGGLSEDFSSDDESIPDDDEDLTATAYRFGINGGATSASGGGHNLKSAGSRKGSHSNGFGATNNGATAAINLSFGATGVGNACTPRSTTLGAMTPKLQPTAPHYSNGHPVPAPLESHFGVKTTFRRRWVTIIQMHICPPSGGLDTTLAEAIGNAVCGPVVDTVTSHRGIVEHLGPMSITISFNCRVPCVMHETEACRVANSISEDLTAILPPEIKFAVVVASGYCIVGDFGVDTHRAKVIIGDAMDIVTRVPPLAVRLGAKVVLTEDTASRVSFECVPIDNILIGGLNAESRLAGGAGITHQLSSGEGGRSIILYELRSLAKNPRGMKSSDSTLFISGFSAFRCGEFAAAADRFRRYCAANDEDPQAKRILELSNWFALNGVVMGPRTYLRREVAWELFEGEIDPTKVSGSKQTAVNNGYTALDAVQSMVPPSPRFMDGSTITPSMRSRESSSRDVSELVRQQIMSNPNAAPSLAGHNPKLEFQEEGLLSMFIVPDDNDDDEVVGVDGGDGSSNNHNNNNNNPQVVEIMNSEDRAALDAAGLGDLPPIPSPPTQHTMKVSAASANEGGGPSSSRKGGGSTITPNTTGSISHSLSVVNGTATNSAGRGSVQHHGPVYTTASGPIFNQSVNSVAIQQPSQYNHHSFSHNTLGAAQQPFLDPHEEMLLLSAEIPLEFLDSSGNRWKRSGTKLGSGAGGAEVFLALGEQGNLVALKCFSLASTKTNLEELIQEVGTLSRLRDDFIVGYVSYAITAHHFIILMEYVSGGSLYQLLEQFGPMALSTARRFMTDILKGLRYLHEERTTHCDIKPHNALLSTEGSCKLTDFGSCMPLEALSRGLPDDMPLVRGTSWYLAPEAARGEVQLANDIWSLGITLIELLTGSHPWQGREYSSLNEMAFIIKLGKDPTMSPPIPNTIEGSAREFIAMCLHRDPKERPTVIELLSHPFIIS